MALVSQYGVDAANSNSINDDTQEIPQSRSTTLPPEAPKEGDVVRAVRTKQTPHMKPQMHKQRRTAADESPWNCL